MLRLQATATQGNLRRAAVAAVTLGLLTFGATGCGESGSGASANSGSAATSSSNTVSPTPNPKPSRLPESVLAPIDGFTYTSEGVDDAALLAQVSEATSDLPQGYLLRGLKNVDGQVVGGVTIMRAATTLSAKDANQAAVDAAAGFAQKTKAKKVTVEGRKSWQATRAGEPQLTGVAWPDGNDIILVWGGSPEDAVYLASAYMKAAG